MNAMSIKEAQSRLEEAGLKVSRIEGVHLLLTQFPKGYYIAIGEDVAKELASCLANNDRINPERISDYFRTRIFCGPDSARSILQPKN